MLSVIIITYNEEEVIKNCLESLVGFAEEIIIVDSESEDRTVEIAKQYTSKLFIRKLTNFSDQRNYAMKKAQGDWVLYIDADEVVTPEFKKEVQHIINNYNKSMDAGYFIHRDTYYFGKRWGLIDRVQRLFLKDDFEVWEGVVHETPRIKGKFGEINSPIKHFTHRSLHHMIKKTNKWSEYEAQLRFDSHHPPMNTVRFIRVILTGFFNSYIKENGYRNGTVGFIESTYQAFSLFITYAKLWEKQQSKKVR